MNILIVIDKMPPDTGGAFIRTGRTYEAIQRSTGITARFICHEGVEAEPEEDRQQRIFRLQYRVTSVRGLLAFVSLFRKYATRADVVHLVGLNPLTILAAWLLYISRKIYISELTIDKQYSRNPFKRLALHAFFNGTAAVAITPRLAKVFEEKGQAPDRIFTRPNPVFESGASVQAAGYPGALVSRMERGEGKIWHLMVGYISERKNQLMALEVLSMLPTAHCLMIVGPVGKNESAYLVRLQAQVKKMELQKRVVIHDQFVSVVDPLYQEAASLWSLSVREGSPNVVSEALMQGCPVFVNRSLGLEGFLFEQDVDGAALPEEPSEAAAAILHFLSGTPDRSGIKRRAGQRFDKEYHVCKTVEFIKGIVK